MSWPCCSVTDDDASGCDGPLSILHLANLTSVFALGGEKTHIRCEVYTVLVVGYSGTWSVTDNLPKLDPATDSIV